MTRMAHTKRTDYGLRVLYELAQRPEHRHSARSLAAEHEVPEAFLRKILMDLREAGIVVAQRGRTGGYRLAADPNEISLASVLKALDSQVVRLPCTDDMPCERDGDCPVRPLWRYLEGRFADQLDRISLAFVVQLGERDRRTR